MLNHLLLRAAEEGSVDAVVACVERGACLETRRPFAMSPDSDYLPMAAEVGLTPLMYAAQAGSTEVCKVLVGARADLEAEDEDGMRPLHFAALSACTETCEMLVLLGASLTASDAEGRTPFDVVPATERVARPAEERWRRVLTPPRCHTQLVDGASPPLSAGGGRRTSAVKAHRPAMDDALEDVGFLEVASSSECSRTHTKDSSEDAAGVAALHGVLDRRGLAEQGPRRGG